MDRFTELFACQGWELDVLKGADPYSELHRNKFSLCKLVRTNRASDLGFKSGRLVSSLDNLYLKHHRL